jgi:polyisoprenoid-binding protein YceI
MSRSQAGFRRDRTAVRPATGNRGVLACVAALAIVAAGGSVVAEGSVATGASAATTAKVGGKCATLNATSGTLVCTRKAGRLVWSRGPAQTTTTVSKTAAAAARSTLAAAPATTVASASGAGTASPAPAGIEGSWKATSKSVVGYRVKEVLIGQSTEGVGRTSAVTGTLTIAGAKVTSVDLTADLTKLESDSDKRDAQVQNRILDTAKYPTATLKLSAPIDFGSEPGDKQEIKAKASAALTVRGVTKTINFEVVARRNGTAIEVNGAIPFTLGDFNIPDPSIIDLVKTEQNGLLEFLVVFER